MSSGDTETTALLRAGAQRSAGTTNDPLPSPTDSSGSGSGSGWIGDDEFGHIPAWRRPSVYWLLPPYLLFTLALGGSIVPKLNLVLDLVCNRYLADRAAADPTFVFSPVVPGSDDAQCSAPSVQAAVQRQVATLMMAISFITGGLSAFTVPKIGSLSDRYGRKRLLVVASAGGIVAEVCVILAAEYPDTVDVSWLMFAAVFDGLSGSFTAATVVTHSYTSDCTPPRKRGVAIGYLHSCLWIGLAFGPLLAGYLVEKVTHELVSIFYIAVVCHVFFVVFVLTVLPESVSRKRQLLAREKHSEDQERLADLAGPGLDESAPFFKKAVAAIRNTPNPLAPLKVLWPKGPANAEIRRNLVILAVIDTIFLGVGMGSGQVTLLYSELMFGWRNLETSNFVSGVSLLRVMVLLGLLPLLNYLFRTRPAAAELRRRRSLGDDTPAGERNNAGADRLDIWMLRAALVSDILGMAGYVLARTPALFVLSAVLAAVGGLGAPTTSAALSKHVPASQVGGLLGAIGLLHALSRLSFPLIINGLYAATVESYPQAAYVLLLGVFVVAFVLAFFVRPHVYVKDDTEQIPA